MKKATTILMTLGILFGLTATSFAHGNNKVPAARKRQANQQQRIHQGVRSGELTKNETRILREDQRDISREIRSSRADGEVTRIERRDIQQEQNQASRRIHRLKTNNRDRN